MADVQAERRRRAQARVTALDADAALVTHAPNVRYLTGLASSNAALLLPVAGEALLATDSRYELAAQRDCPDLDLLTERYLVPALGREASRRGCRRLAFEDRHMTVAAHRELAGQAAGVELVPLGTAVEELRVAKDDGELDLLAGACRISCLAFAEVLPEIAPGVAERQLATAIERAMADLGAEAPAFGTIVASGPNGALPHHVPGERPLQAGDLITIDFGARYRGYHADMTRTVCLGEPAGWQRDIYDLVARAQQAGIEAARPDAELRDVDAAARDLIGAAGHGEHFRHGLGHGVGLEAHEAPTIGYGSAGRLAARVPLTVEPGVYLPGRGGVRIEDVVVTGGDGTTLLTTTTRELLAL